MPWKIFKDGEQFCVHKEDAEGGKSERVACHDSEEKATAQLRVLYASEGKASEWVMDTTADVPCADCEDDTAKAGKRLNASMLAAARNALLTLAQVVKWAEYSDKEEPKEDTAEDEKEDAAEDAVEEKAVDYAVKSVSPGRVRGYAVLWGSESEKDLTGEFFTPETQELETVFSATQRLPWLYHHAANDQAKTVVAGIVDAMGRDELGLWYEAQRRMATDYDQAIDKLIADGLLRTSSGTLPRARRVTKDGRITRWPIVEISGTPAPADWRQRQQPITVVKAAFEELGLKMPDEVDDEADTKKQVALELERLALLKL